MTFLLSEVLKNFIVKFEVLMVVTVKSITFRNVAPYYLVGVY
jgi:hypothetical protein